MGNYELMTSWLLDLRKKLQSQRELSKFCPEQTEGWRCHRLRWENGRCHRLLGKVGDQLRAPEPSWSFPSSRSRVLASGSFMIQRVPPSHPGRLRAPASSWQATWRISSPVVSCGRVAATRSRTRDSWPRCPSRSPRCVACRLFF
uniref:Uncharacterized protein n=1 Tax=Pan troglodytes TaxID=9598 RepID=A0A2I3ST59_PANTR